ncbi:hypothetical protein D0C36_03235 [Mucilaginibacter conchicola]|uniref:Outer membrane protein beta-barrel domain-containing protein n=1 Tax=Mucilaginibacter conchicola TaxID=2303333 RepID=A0A372NWS9_9SPHI|nr:hypothetical protein [Mucilaginibacter conchicola]RFZ94573.1 hypothetical protein D0C36_03235 [Mucilaginibacter conchicola]
MKKVNKLIAAAFTAAALFIGTNVNAQTTPKSNWRLGIGVEGLAPVGDLHTGSNFGLGGTARLQYGLGSNVALSLTSGYYNFFAKEVNGIKGDDLGIVPVKAGIKAFVANNIYLGAEIGAGFETRENGNTKLIASPGIGWANSSWDVGARYENFSGQSNNYGTVGLRIAYGFPL